MNKSIISKLKLKTREELLEIVINLGNIDGVIEFIKLHYVSKPNEAVKELKKIFDKYKRKTNGFYDYYKTNGFFSDLVENLILPIQTKLIKVAPMECANLVQYMLDSFERLVANKDDSSGCGMDFLYTCVDLWGKSWQHVENRDRKELAQLVNNYYRNHQYIGSCIFESFKTALGKEGLLYLEELLADDSRMLLHIVEQQNDPDKYLETLKQRKLISDNQHILKLSHMLVDNFRADEAIDWLVQITKNNTKSEYYIECKELLIKAYEDDNRIEDAQNVRWELFKTTIAPECYLEFIKRIKSKEAQNKYRQEAITHALNTKDFDSTLKFIEAIQEYEKLEELIINNLERLSEYHYSYYRKLSKTLASNGKYLSAILLRRYVANNILLQAKSKYYDYAISDLKQSMDFGDKVQNWKSVDDTKTYFNQLIETHKKKYSFLEKLYPLLKMIT